MDQGKLLRKKELAVFENDIPVDTILSSLSSSQELVSDQPFLKEEVIKSINQGTVVAVLKKEDDNTLLIQVKL